MKCQILLGSDEFVQALQRDLEEARHYAYMQVLNFEADAAGHSVAALLRSCRAPDRRLIVDEYVRLMISDRFLYSLKGLLDGSLQAEARSTSLMLSDMPREGIAVRMTNPMGFALSRLPQRNHKKLVMIDDRIAYIGGINVADHNFEWHDFMLRVADCDVTRFLREDFCLTWTGDSVSASRSYDGMDLFLCDGRNNETYFDVLFDLIDRARESIWVQSPYLSFPFFEYLHRASDRGVEVVLVAPAENNKPLFDAYTKWEASRSGMPLVAPAASDDAYEGDADRRPSSRRRFGKLRLPELPFSAGGDRDCD